MKTLALLLLVLFSPPQQSPIKGVHRMSTVLTLACPATYQPGSSLICTVSKAGDIPAGLQFTFQPDTRTVGWSASVGAAADGAGKALQFNAANGICLIVGFNATTIPDGIVARLVVAVPPGLSSPLMFSIISPVATDAIGAAISATVNGPVSVARVTVTRRQAGIFKPVGAEDRPGIFRPKRRYTPA
jgi:hypothetical protein